LETVTTRAHKTILPISASVRKSGTVTFELNESLLWRFLEKAPGAKVISRDVYQRLPLPDYERVETTCTKWSERSA